MFIIRSALLVLTLALAGCALVQTHVVPLNPARTLPPTQSVEVLLEKPQRPHTDIALLESRGDIGVTEAELLNHAREKARTLGADAIVRVEGERVYHPPVAVYDPWADPFYWGWHRYRRFPLHPHPWGAYRVVGGGFTQTVKTLAIKYEPTEK